MTDAVLSIATGIRAAIGLASENEMSDILQVSKQTLATWRCKKKGPPSVRLGKRVFYPVSDFNTWIGSQRAEQQDAPKRPRLKQAPSVPTQTITIKDHRDDAQENPSAFY